MTIPIIGQGKPRDLFCVRCNTKLEMVPAGVVCMRDTCLRFGLVSVIGKDPTIEGQEQENSA